MVMGTQNWHWHIKAGCRCYLLVELWGLYVNMVYHIKSFYVCAHVIFAINSTHLNWNQKHCHYVFNLMTPIKCIHRATYYKIYKVLWIYTFYMIRIMINCRVCCNSSLVRLDTVKYGYYLLVVNGWCCRLYCIWNIAITLLLLYFQEFHYFCSFS